MYKLSSNLLNKVVYNYWLRMQVKIGYFRIVLHYHNHRLLYSGNARIVLSHSTLAEMAPMTHQGSQHVIATMW